MNYIDNNLKKIDQNKTIGIIICRQDNKNVIKYISLIIESLLENMN